MPPSARITDMHTCPIHGGGPIVVGEPTILVGYVPAARIGDALVCPCGPDIISEGESSVLFGGRPASRLGDSTVHGGVIAQGCPTVLIGSTAQIEALKTDKPLVEKCPLEESSLEAVAAGMAGADPDLIDREVRSALASAPLTSALLADDAGQPAGAPQAGQGAVAGSPAAGSSSLAGVSLVQTLDTEFSHLDGYDGKRVALGEQDPRSLLGETWRQQRRRVERAAAQDPLRTLPLYHYDPRRHIAAEPPEAPFKQLAQNGGLYVGFAMSPAQGYMPKETTARGRKTGEVTREFFRRAAAEGAPVQAAVAPAGPATADRERYIDLASDEVRDRYRDPVDGSLGPRERGQYFQDQFVHPDAWRPVLQENPSLRLGLSGWAGDAALWRDSVADLKKPAMTPAELREFHKWARGQAGPDYHRELHRLWPESPLSASRAMPAVDGAGHVHARGWLRSSVEMTAAYPNVYVDLSGLPIAGSFTAWSGEPVPYANKLGELLREHPHLLGRVMLGTGASASQADALVALTQVEEALGGQHTAQSLLRTFTVDNPDRFYRLGENADRLKDNLTASIGRLDDGDRARMLSDLERRHLALKAARGQTGPASAPAAVGPGAEVPR